MRWAIRWQKIIDDKVLEDGNYQQFEFDTDDPLQALSNYLHKHDHLWDAKYIISLYQADTPYGIHRVYKLLPKLENKVKQISPLIEPKKQTFELPPSQLPPPRYEAKSEEEEVKNL